MQISAQVIQERLVQGIHHAQTRLFKFKDNFESNPAYAFEWSSSAFEAAGELEMRAMVLRHLVKASENALMEELSMATTFRIPNTAAGCKEFLQSHHKELIEFAMREAESPSHSTSVQSNEMARCKASAAVKLAKELSFLISKC